MTSYNIQNEGKEEKKEDEERGIGAPPDTEKYGGKDGGSGEPGAASL